MNEIRMKHNNHNNYLFPFIKLLWFALVINRKITGSVISLGNSNQWIIKLSIFNLYRLVQFLAIIYLKYKHAWPAKPSVHTNVSTT